MKGYTDFAMGFMGAAAVATKPIGNMKYMDWGRFNRLLTSILIQLFMQGLWKIGIIQVD